ncbi:MAG: hypothetical protein ACHQ0Y_04890 [Thermodesulfovibrionales bacterium]
MIVKTIDLHCKTENGTDKVYHIALEKTEDGFNVLTAYGKRGRALTYGNKGRGVSQEKGEKIYEGLLKEKLQSSPPYDSNPGVSGKVFEGAPDAVSGESSLVSLPEIKKNSGHVPQLLNAIEAEEVDLLIENPSFGAQEKFDGDRLAVRVNGVLEGINKKGYLVPVSPVIADAVLRLNRNIFLDGENMGDRLCTFGLLEYGGIDLRRKPYVKVHETLSEVLRDHTGNGLEVVPLAVTAQEKRALYERVKKENGEGIVFKLLSACYSPGRPASLGSQRKFKFTADASVIITQLNDKRSVQMSVYADGKLLPIGNVTIPPNHDVPKVGSICDVKYLYAYAGGGCLFQPQYKGIRYDVSEDECVVSQLKYKKTSTEESAAA